MLILSALYFTELIFNYIVCEVLHNSLPKEKNPIPLCFLKLYKIQKNNPQCQRERILNYYPFSQENPEERLSPEPRVEWEESGPFTWIPNTIRCFYLLLLNYFNIKINT
jgi:hypothetical protein